jgi:HTH-type transcriptional regulator / antitoxin HigA
MSINSIETDDDHDEALREVERLWGSPLGTPNGDRLDSLLKLVEAYERVHFPIKLPGTGKESRD